MQLVFRRDWRPAPSHLVYRTDAPNILLRPHGYGYRLPLLYLMAFYAAAQASVYLNIFEVTFGQGRWDHWHANSSIAFHSILLLASFVIYFGQQIPQVPAMLEIASLIKYSRLHSDQTLAHVQAMHLTNQIMWSDAGLRQKVSNWYDGRRESIVEDTSDHASDHLFALAQDHGVDASALRKSSQLAARGVWAETQPNCQEWEQAVSVQSASVSEPLSPLASSLSQ
ncbi:hypothetical protein CBS101457_006204 [Exobasidium rhododendri]|nr:hypothetical protein CBS101457_006204 [Exobasidium rhododendri]